MVYNNEKYILLKIYIKDDKRPEDYSLLRNGTADISLIDSPGLNMDSVKTTEVMSSQEEIDLVVFVVNAENQLTLSAREFISMASREKKLMFFVVNKFDHIKDKERCKKLILNQIKEISPETYKQNREFVHFVSSYGKVPDDDGDGPDGDDSDGEHGNHDDPDFDRLEDNLRNFVLKKRSLSKLLPAKTYLIKLLKDLENISECNLQKYRTEDHELNVQLDSLEPDIKETNTRCLSLIEAVDKLSDFTIKEVYAYTKVQINKALILQPSEFPPYHGVSNLYDYLQRVRTFIMDQILSSVQVSESYAKNSAVESVNQINSLAKEQLGEDFMADKVFKSDLMFTKKKHNLSKSMNIPFELQDFLSPSIEGFVSYLSWGFVKPTAVAESGENAKTWTQSLALTNYSLSQYWTNPSLIFTSKIPTLLIYSFGGTKVITNAALFGSQFFSIKSLKNLSGSLIFLGSVLGLAYLIHDLPRALPMNLSKKYKLA